MEFPNSFLSLEFSHSTMLLVFSILGDKGWVCTAKRVSTSCLCKYLCFLTTHKPPYFPLADITCSMPIIEQR